MPSPINAPILDLKKAQMHGSPYQYIQYFLQIVEQIITRILYYINNRVFENYSLGNTSTAHLPLPYEQVGVVGQLRIMTRPLMPLPLLKNPLKIC